MAFHICGSAEPRRSQQIDYDLIILDWLLMIRMVRFVTFFVALFMPVALFMLVAVILPVAMFMLVAVILLVAVIIIVAVF